MDDLNKPIDVSSRALNAPRMITLISSVDINTRLTLGFVLIVAVMSVGIVTMLWQSHVMRTQANRLTQLDEQFIEVQRVHALVLSFRSESEQSVRARNLARLQQEAPALRNELNDSLRQTRAVFRGVEPDNILDPTVLPTLETIQTLLPSQVDSLVALASIGDWEALTQRMQQPLEPLENLNAELMDAASRDLQNKRSEAARRIERAQVRTLFILPGVGGLTVVIAALLGFGITQSITRPLRSLVEAASALASGEFGHHVPVRGRDELAHLSQVFNQTTLKLQDLYENLRRSEKELRNVINYLAEAQRLGHIGNWVFDPAKGFEYWSDELFRIHDLDPDKGPPNSQQYLAAVHPQDREFMASLMKRLLADGSGFDATKRIVRTSGEVRYVRCVGATDFDNDPSKRIGVGMDVTDHEMLTQELRRREAHLAEAQRLGHIGSWVFVPAGAFEYWSHELFRIYGLDPEREAPTLDEYLTCIHPHDREFMASLIKRMVAEASGCDVTKRIVRPNGEVRYIRCVGAPVLENGTLKRIVGSAIDVTEHELLTRELRRREAYLTEAQKLSHTGSFGWNPDTGEIVWSDETYRIFEYDSALEPTLSSVVQRIHLDDRALAQQVIDHASQTGTDFEHEYRLLLPDGRVKHVHAIARALQDGSGNREFIGAVSDITERKTAEEELRSSEAYLAEAQRLSHTGSWAWSPDTDVRYWSEECYRILGFDPQNGLPRIEELIQRIHPDDQPAFRESVNRSRHNKLDEEVDYRIVHPSGAVREIHSIGHPVFNPCGGLIEYTGTVIDTTERKRAEEELRRKERELRTLIEAIPAYVGTNLPDGSLDFINQGWLDYAGLSREQVMGWEWGNSIHPDDFDRVMANWRAAVAAGVPVEHELRCRCADGTYHWFLYRGVPFRDDGGNVVKWYGTLMNIDALKETEHALQTREHELLGIIDTVPSMLWSVSPTGESTHLSQRFREYWGVRFEEIANRGWVDLIHPDDREETTKAFFRAIETGDSFSSIQRLRRADGEYRWHHSMGEPLHAPDGKIIQWYGLSIDIDERKRAEDHLRDTSIKLAKASRLATVAELAGSIAHELNQPLMAVLANAQAAKRWLNAASPNVAEVNSSIERIIRDSRAADETMQHIRALFKQESFDKKDVNIPNILREVVRIVQEDPKKREIPIRYHFEESLPAVPVDQIQIQQVFINLIVNAIEALEGRQVTPMVAVRAVADSNEMLIQVIDNGPGVDDPHRIFDAFMTTKEKGMGIGLAVSRSIVEAHGGRLWAENNKTGGATLNVALPLSHVNPTTAHIQEYA